jgi:hypothetical protein
MTRSLILGHGRRHDRDENMVIRNGGHRDLVRACGAFDSAFYAGSLIASYCSIPFTDIASFLLSARSAIDITTELPMKDGKTVSTLLL